MRECKRIWTRKANKSEKVLFLFQIPVFTKSLFRAVSLFGLGACSDLGACEKFFPNLGAYLSMGAYLSPGCLIGNLRYITLAAGGICDNNTFSSFLSVL